MKKTVGFFRKNTFRLLSLLISVVLILQLVLDYNNIALGAGSSAFRGYGNENITHNTFEFLGSAWNSNNVEMTGNDDGEAVGFIEFDSSMYTPINLGGLEISFSTTTVVQQEGTDGADNDVPSATIEFYGAGNSLKGTVTLVKPDNSVSGPVALSSNAAIPLDTHVIVITLTGDNTVEGSDNTIVFETPSLIINDAGVPTINVSYNSGWTNNPVDVTVTAADSDSGLEGIYQDGVKVSVTSPYAFQVASNTSFVFTSKDYAGMTSDAENVSITNIDTSAPAPPATLTLSHDTWTNTDVSVTVPALGPSSGAPEKYVYRLGADAWRDMPANYTVTDSGVYDIGVAVADEAGNMSSALSDTIHIDKLAPSIDLVTQTVQSGSCVLDVEVSDAGLSGLDDVKYAAGSHDAAYFAADGGNTITDGSFTVYTGGVYTVYVSDHAGNDDIAEYTVNTAPSLVDILDITIDEDETVNIPVNASDGETALDALLVRVTSSDTDLISDIDIYQSASAISFDITPALNLSGGPVTITVEVEDEPGEVVSDTFMVTVAPANDNPVAVDDLGVTTAEDTSVFINAAANDTDVDGDTLTVSAVGTPAHGTASIVAGRVKYTPAANYNGDDSVTYTVSDGAGSTATGTIFISISAVNDDPIAVADMATTMEDTAVLIDVLDNDDDPDISTSVGEVISLQSVQNGTHGQAVATPEGLVQYTPEANWFGRDSFTYTIADQMGRTCSAAVQVTVTGVPDDPEFRNLNGSYSVLEDSTDAEISFEIFDVETEAKSLMLQAVSLDETILKNSKIKVEGLGDNNDSVVIKVTPERNMFGVVRINLSLGDGFATVTDYFDLTVTNTNDPPVAVDDTVSYDEDDTRVTILPSTLIGNDTDIDGDTLSFVDIDTTTSIGTLVPTDESKTAYYYYPNPNSELDDTFTYIVADGAAQDIGTCRLTMAPVNDPPTVTLPPGDYFTWEDITDAPITFNISDEETAPADLAVKASGGDTSLISPAGLTVTNNGDGTCALRIQPMQDAFGTADIEIMVSDGSATATTRFSYEIRPVADSPVAVDDSIYVPLSGRQVFSVLLNDHDADGDELTVSAFDDDALGGLLTYDAGTRMFTYHAANGETGDKTFTYTVSDSDETTPDSSAIVTLHINTGMHDPVISPIGDQHIAEDNNTGYLPFGVTDEDLRESFTISVASSNPALLAADNPACADVINYDSEQFGIKLTPLANKNGQTTITVTATDTTGRDASTTFILYVSPENDPPVAVDDVFTTDEDTPATLPMLLNDSDPEGDTIRINSVTSPVNGYITRSGSTYTYTPYINWNGTEHITYTLTDGQFMVTADVTINVMPVNDAPIARDDWLEIENTPNQSGTIAVLNNDSDIERDTLKTYQIVTNGTYGTAVINEEDGTITYTRSPVQNTQPNGADLVVYRVIDRSDATGDYKYDDATIHIGEVFDDVLYCDDVYVERLEDSGTYTINLPIHNPKNVEYEVSVDSAPLGGLGTFSNITDNSVDFTPAADQFGNVTITYTATPVTGAPKQARIYLRIYPINDAPVIDSAPESLSCNEDDPKVEFDVAFHDADCVDSELYFYAFARNASTTAPVPLKVSVSHSRGTGTAHVTVVPPENANGSLNIIVGVSDGLLKAERTISLTITAVDDAPDVTDISRSLYEDTSVRFSVITAGSDVDGDSLVVSIGAPDGPAHGAAVVNGDGTITYTPDENYYGPDSLVFSVADDREGGLVTRKTATFDVVPVNDPPVITGLPYYQTTSEDTPKAITFYVSDVDDDMSPGSCYTFASEHGDIVDADDISIAHVAGNQMRLTVNPVENAFGRTLIRVNANDGELTTYADFQLTVLPVNDRPVAQDDIESVDERVGTPVGTTSVTIDLIDNDTDVEDASLDVVSIFNISTGTVTNNLDGTVTFSVGGDFNGDATFDYTVSDDNGATDDATVTVTVNPMNDPPRAANDTATITEDEEMVLDVLANDNDPEYDSLTISDVYGFTQGGSAVNNGATLAYTPAANYNGSESFYYVASDGHGGTATARVDVTIRPDNDAPDINKHASTGSEWTMQEDSVESFNFVVSDPESPVSSLIITLNSQVPAKLKNTQMKLSSTEEYKVITVTPEEDANGVIPVEFKVTDGALTTTKVYNITIQAVNDPPEFGPMHITTQEDRPVSGTVTAIDPEGDAVTCVKASDPEHGSVIVNADGTYTYTPDENYSGEDSFTVTGNDGQPENNTGTGTVTVTVTPVNDKPEAVDDAGSTPEDTAVLIDVLDNDTDADKDSGDSLAILSVSTPANGTAVTVSGQIRYTPRPDWNGIDSFTYMISDSEGEKDTATVTVAVAPVNDAPAGGDDAAETDEDTAITIDVTVNDDIDETTNPAIEDVKVIQVGAPANGMAAITPDEKSIDYTPDANWSGTDTFTYTARDVENEEAVFNVTVLVHPVNDAPVITVSEPYTELPDISTNEDMETGAVTFKVSDMDNTVGELTVTATHPNSALLPSITVTPDVNGDCSFTVQPKANKNGSATITVTVKDPGMASDTDSFILTVNPMNDAPAAQNDSATTPENEVEMIDVLANDDVDIDNEGDTLTITNSGTPQFGTVRVVTGSNGRDQIEYTPDATRDLKTSYTDTFTYTMKDASEATSGAQVTVTVTPVNDPPTISGIADMTGIPEDLPAGTGAVSFTVTDEEDDDDTLAITVASSNTALFPLSSITVINPEGGTGSERTVQAIPAQDKFGSSTIRLTVRDAEGLTSYDEFTVTVDPVDDEPADGDDTFTVTEDVRTQLNVLINDDVDYATSPDDLTITGIVNGPDHGEAEIAADGKSIYYTTDPDSNNPDSFVYRMRDSRGTPGSNEYNFTVTINVTPVNDAPVITYLGQPSYTVSECVPQNDIPFIVTDVDNDTDNRDGSVEVTLSAASDSLRLVRNGLHIDAPTDSPTGNERNIDVQPYLKWNGFTIITITATDPGGLTGTATFEFIVESFNDPPVAYDDTFTINEDVRTAVDVLANDEDDDLETNPLTEHLYVDSVVDNDPNAIITVEEGDGRVVVDPNDDYNGPVTFTYVTKDAGGKTSSPATVTVTVNQVNDAPVADDDSAVTPEDTPVSIDVLAGDSDIDMTAGLNAHPELESISISIDEAGLLDPAYGSIAVVAGEILYTPDADYNGTDTFEYNCDDGEALTTATVSVTITQVNDNPDAVTDSATAVEDGFIDIYPLNNDTDVDTTAGLNEDDLHLLSELSVTSASINAPAHGTLAQDGNKLTYTPYPNSFAGDVITYAIEDAHGGTDTGIINVTVTSVNDLPVFDVVPDEMDLVEDGVDGVGSLTVSDIETLAENLVVTVTESSRPTIIGTGDVTITPGTGGVRNITVNPKDNQNGTAVITLRVTDGDGGYTDCTFTVNVEMENDPPVALDDAATINEGGSYAKDWSLLTGEVDIETNDDSVTIEIITPPAHGTADVVDEDITYVPNANWNGVDSFVYKVTDTQGLFDTGTITITVLQVNDAPVADDDSAVVLEDTPTDIDVLDGDTDIDQTPGLNADPSAEVLSISINEADLLDPRHGTISVVDGQILYTPDANYNGSDTFEYNVDDGEALDKATVTVSISQVNDNPTAVPDSGATADETPVSVDVLANDTDIDTDAGLNEAELHSLDTLAVQSCAFVDAANGTLALTDGVITFTPALNFSGTQVISYVLVDGHGGSATGYLTITTDEENDPPVANDDDITTAEDTPLSHNVLDNDEDQDPGDVLSFVSFNAPTDGLPGTIGATADGVVTFTPNSNYHGSFTIGYTVRDAAGLTDTADLTITVTAVNDRPVANDDTVTTAEDTPKGIDVSGLISDADILTDGDSLTITVGSGSGPQHGHVSVNGYIITYTPDADWNGTDSFVYTATDESGEFDTGTITVTVTPVNDAPAAVADSVSVNEDASIRINVLANDTDVDMNASLNAVPQGPLSVETIIQLPANGVAVIEGNQVRYTPIADYNGPDSFTYRVTDGEYNSVATVTLAVRQVNDNPAAVNDTATTTDGDAVLIDVLGNDTDIDTIPALNMGGLHNRSSFTVTSVGTASNGTVTIKDGKVNYLPGATFAGADSFTYTMSDGYGGTATARVTVTVLSANDPPDVPVVSAPYNGQRYGGSATIHVAWSGFDIDGDPLTYALEYYDGISWRPVVSGLTATEYDFTIPPSLSSITSLQFRVNASDMQYTSGYGYSGRVSVDKDIPADIVVTMRTADGRGYTAGTWTNQNVIVTAVSVRDASAVSFRYALEDKAYASLPNMTVTNGVHNVFIEAADEFGNRAEFGGYLARIDKQAPAVPDSTVSTAGGNGKITLKLLSDPGGSGNRTMTMPDGTRLSLIGLSETIWTVNKNGAYAFDITDVAGNTTRFTVTVSGMDETPPQISCNSGTYVIGETSVDVITAALSFTDDVSEIMAKGFAVSGASAYSGVYSNYTRSIVFADPGTYYIHATAQNAFGLKTYKTFGPFIVAGPEPVPSVGEPPTPTPEPTTGNVMVNPTQVVENGKKIRLPGGEWADSLVLEDIAPGTYLVEVMDEDGNVTLAEVTITDEAIAAGTWQPVDENDLSWLLWAGAGTAGLVLLLLLWLWRNTTVEVCAIGGNGRGKVLRTFRWLKRRKDVVTVSMKAKQVRDGEYGRVILSGMFTKRMEGRRLSVTLDGTEVLNVEVPKDTEGRFEHKIEKWQITTE